jgi:hypothetical protein
MLSEMNKVYVTIFSLHIMLETADFSSYFPVIPYYSRIPSSLSFPVTTILWQKELYIPHTRCDLPHVNLFPLALARGNVPGHECQS